MFLKVYKAIFSKNFASIKEIILVSQVILLQALFIVEKPHTYLSLRVLFKEQNFQTVNIVYFQI